MDDEGHKRMYCSSKSRSLISIAILVIIILQTNLLKAHAHASVEINNVSSDDGYVVLHLYENKTSFKKFNPDRIYKKVATKGKTIGAIFFTTFTTAFTAFFTVLAINAKKNSGCPVTGLIELSSLPTT